METDDRKHYVPIVTKQRNTPAQVNQPAISARLRTLAYEAEMAERAKYHG